MQRAMQELERAERDLARIEQEAADARVRVMAAMARLVDVAGRRPQQGGDDVAGVHAQGSGESP